MVILEKLAKNNDGARRKFCKEMIKYLRDTWLDGSIPREVWNMYQHRGVSTNNHAEVSIAYDDDYHSKAHKCLLQGFNFKMGAKKQISKHPNPYTLVDEFRSQLREASDTVVAETFNIKKKRVNTDYLANRKELMKDLAKRNIDLESYMIQIGGKTLKYQPKVMSDPDPDPLGLGERRCLSDGQTEENEENNIDDSSNYDSPVDVSLDETPEISARVITPTSPPRPRSPSPTPAPMPRSKPSKKGPVRRKRQTPVENSEESFIHIEGQPEKETNFGASIGGNELRDARRREEEPTASVSDLFASALSVAAVASAGVSLVSRFSSRSSARRSSSRRSVGNTSSFIPSSPKGSSDPIVLGRKRVQSLGFRFSSSQPITRGDGNCMLHCIFDQLRKSNHSILKSVKSDQDLRLFICSKLQSQLDDNKIFWVSDVSPKKWLSKMKNPGVWGDDVFLQITANVFNKNIILIPLHSSSSHNAGMYIDIRSVDGGCGDPLFMLYFEEWR